MTKKQNIKTLNEMLEELQPTGVLSVRSPLVKGRDYENYEAEIKALSLYASKGIPFVSTTPMWSRTTDYCSEPESGDLPKIIEELKEQGRLDGIDTVTLLHGCLCCSQYEVRNILEFLDKGFGRGNVYVAVRDDSTLVSNVEYAGYGIYGNVGAWEDLQIVERLVRV